MAHPLPFVKLGFVALIRNHPPEVATETLTVIRPYVVVAGAADQMADGR